MALMRRVSRVYRSSVNQVVIAVGLILISQNAWAVEPNKAVDACRSFIESLGLKGEEVLAKTDIHHNALNERHSLAELFAPDATNLVVQHPFIILSAPQAIWMIAKEAGVTEISNPRTGAGTIPKYNLVSRGAGLTNGRIIIGQEIPIARMMRTVRAQARGSKSSKSTPLLMGIRGTAKSELLEILKTALYNANLRNPRYYHYTFEFVNLEAIPALKPHLRSDEKRSQISDSPFSILPTELQDLLLQKLTPTIRQAIQMDPLPKRIPDPQSRFYVEKILEHYAKEVGHDLTMGEMIEYLDKHIVIRRAILGTENNAPIIPAQLKDVDEAGLFMSKNTAVALEFGAGHPLAWNFGRVPQGNRGFVMWDEILKNDPSFLRKLLTLLQSKRLQAAGGPELDLDTLFIASTNTEDVAAELERNPSSPLTDRFTVVVMNLLLEPHLIAKGMAYEQRDLEARKLGEKDAKFQPVRGDLLHEVFPDRESIERPVLTSDRRYALRLDLKGDSVHIAPHSLMFMAMTASLSRMQFDPAKLQQYKDAFPNVRWEDPILRDRTSRLKAMLGQIQVKQAKLIEMWNVSKVANEGGFGMSHRDVERWWELALDEAQRDGNQNTITPMLLRRALAEGIKDKVLVDGDLKRGAELMRNAEVVFQEFIRPEMTADMNLAIMGGPKNEVLNQIYDEIILEVLARDQDPAAKTYLAPPNHEPKSIKEDRLKDVMELYKKETGRALDISEVAQMTVAFQRAQGGALQSPRNHSLLKAIQDYHSRAVQRAENVNMGRLLKVARGGQPDAKPAERQKASEFLQVLTDDLGYNEISAQRALEVVSSPSPTQTKESESQ